MWTYWGVGFGLIAPIIMFLIEYRIERKLDIVMSPREWIPNPKWPQDKPRYLVGYKLVDFVPRMQQYTKTAEIMITLASASILFVPSHLSKHPMLALSVTLLGFAVLWVCFSSFVFRTAMKRRSMIRIDSAHSSHACPSP
jgi:hypothetical protein